MIEINLLPGGAARRPTAARGVAGSKMSLPKMGGDPREVALGALAVALLLLAAWSWWSTGQRRDELQGQVERETADSTRLTGTINLVASVDAKKDTIERKIGVIRSVDERRYVWPHILDEVSRATPQYTWLTKIASSEQSGPSPVPGRPAPPPPAAKPDTAKPDTTAAARAAREQARADSVRLAVPGFTVEGNTASPQALTRFMKNLEASPMIKDVTLVTSQQSAEVGRTFLKFTLEAKYEIPDSSIVQTVPVVATR
ncbi:MAG TPA: PilN domain-containing protein [Longimicrobiaceae bacterium]|nr:PilN domain-containing protein [Longimicrobiaceae bacterium]